MTFRLDGRRRRRRGGEGRRSFVSDKGTRRLQHCFERKEIAIERTGRR